MRTMPPPGADVRQSWGSEERAESGASAPCCRPPTARSRSCAGTRTAMLSASPGERVRNSLSPALLHQPDPHRRARNLLEQVRLLVSGPDLKLAPPICLDDDVDRLAALPRVDGVD